MLRVVPDIVPGAIPGAVSKVVLGVVPEGVSEAVVQLVLYRYICAYKYMIKNNGFVNMPSLYALCLSTFCMVLYPPFLLLSQGFLIQKSCFISQT